MGDMILTFPVLKAIKDSYPNSEISVVCSNANSFLCKEVPFIDNYYIFDKKDNFISKLKFFINFRKVTYDIIFNFSQTIETFLLLLGGKSVDKSTLIYLSRYSNPKFSKIFQRLITKKLSFDYIKINRKIFFEKRLKFHQTEIMFQLLKKKLDIKKPKSFILKPNLTKHKKIFQERILVHLSERWIDHKYNEDLFLDLLTKLYNNYGKLYLSTDQSSYKSFIKTYQLFEKYNDSNLHKLIKNHQKILILDKLNFQNWRNAIINSKLVITYECGCVHVASMSNAPLLVVYDYKNKPYMINKEYAPFNKNYQKIIANQEMINEKIMMKLKKFKN